MTEMLPIAGLLLGLAGSPHCVAMCGGIASAVHANPNARGSGGGRTSLLDPLWTGLGRVTSYSAIGALAGSSGFLLVTWLGPNAGLVARASVGVALIVLAFGVLGLRPLRKIETIGRGVWQALRPLARRVDTLPAGLRPLALGALWGWLPCGMVYAAAVTAAATGSAGGGALFMLGFGVGTLPAVSLAGVGASRVFAGLRGRGARRGAALLLAVCGLWTLLAVPVMHRAAGTLDDGPHAAHSHRAPDPGPADARHSSPHSSSHGAPHSLPHPAPHSLPHGAPHGVGHAAPPAAPTDR